MSEKFIVAGYEFQSEAEAKSAREELAKVNALHNKMDMNNFAALKAVYLKAIEQNIFETQIGISYLKNIRDYLVSNKIISEEENPLPILYSKNTVSDERKKMNQEMDILKQNLKQNFDNKLDEERNKTKKALLGCKRRNWICFILVIMVLFMFAISFTGKNPNILNYKTAITNQYSAWEQELNERESKIREKEAELGISN